MTNSWKRRMQTTGRSLSCFEKKQKKEVINERKKRYLWPFKGVKFSQIPSLCLLRSLLDFLAYGLVDIRANTSQRIGHRCNDSSVCAFKTVRNICFPLQSYVIFYHFGDSYHKLNITNNFRLCRQYTARSRRPITCARNIVSRSGV